MEVNATRSAVFIDMKLSSIDCKDSKGAFCAAVKTTERSQEGTRSSSLRSRRSFQGPDDKVVLPYVYSINSIVIYGNRDNIHFKGGGSLHSQHNLQKG